MSSYVNNICKHCKNSYKAVLSELKRGKGHFCSVDCYHKSISTIRTEKKCIECGSSFVIKHINRKDQKFCSRLCYTRFVRDEKNRANKLKKCVYCDNYVARKPNYKKLRFCSLKCSVRYRYLNKENKKHD